MTKRAKRHTDWNAKKNEGKGAYVVSPVNTPTKGKAVSKLALYKSFKSDMVTKLQLSDKETQEIFGIVMANAYNEDSNEESLKD